MCWWASIGLDMPLRIRAGTANIRGTSVTNQGFLKGFLLRARHDWAQSDRSMQEGREMLRYRAWYVTGSAALMLALIMGTLVNGLTAFFVPIEAAEGWGRKRP